MESDKGIDRESVVFLARILAESDLTELEYEQGGRRIRVVKAAPPPVSQVFHAPAQTVLSEAPRLETSSSAHVKAAGTSVTSPLVGTVYVAPEPGAPPFVTAGTIVQEGQTLLIVEAMKIMNPIKAPHAGRIQEICIEDGAPVEFGENLLYLVVES